MLKLEISKSTKAIFSYIHECFFGFEQRNVVSFCRTVSCFVGNITGLPAVFDIENKSVSKMTSFECILDFCVA